MRYVLLAVLVTSTAALSGCFSDNNNDFETREQFDQGKANLAVARTQLVINASNNLNTDEPQDISRIILPEANLAEPVAITGANSSL